MVGISFVWLRVIGGDGEEVAFAGVVASVGREGERMELSLSRP